MSRGAELLAAICANPADAQTRLVYADWLTQSGDPRGAFIAQHCQLEQMTGLEDGYPALLASTRRLEGAHARRWLADYLQRTGIEHYGSRVRVDALCNPVFRHGFLYRIAGRLQDIAAQWPWLREREPVQGMELLVGEHVPDEFHKLTEPRAWRTLKISPDSWFTANSIGDALRWGFPELRDLDLSGCDVGTDGCRLLANLETTMASTFDGWTAPPPLPEGQLTHLTLHGCQLTDAGARTLFAATTLSALQSLIISQCRLAEVATLEALRDAASMAGLTRLSLAGNKALGGQLTALAGWSVLPRLVHFALPQTATPDDVAALFPQPSARLRSLDVTSAKALMKTPDAIAEVAENLTELRVGTTSLGDKGWQQLLSASAVHSVVELRANGCSLSDKAIAALTESPVQRLVTLDLSSNKLSDKGLAQLAEWPGLAHVTHLRVGNNRRLKLPGYRALIDSPHLQPARLDIGKCSNASIVEPLRERFGHALAVRTS